MHTLLRLAKGEPHGHPTAHEAEKGIRLTEQGRTRGNEEITTYTRPREAQSQCL